MNQARGDRMLSIETQHLPEKECIVVSFTDTGVGIPQENLSKLFEPFFSTKKKGKGVGLGLSVAYGIIQEHGGSIQVQSEEGKWNDLQHRTSSEDEVQSLQQMREVPWAPPKS